MKTRLHSAWSIDSDYQGYILYNCRMYARLPPKKQIYIVNLCLKVGDEYSQALMEAVTTDEKILCVATGHYMDESNLCKYVRKFYESFDIDEFETG